MSILIFLGPFIFILASDLLIFLQVGHYLSALMDFAKEAKSKVVEMTQRAKAIKKDLELAMEA